MTPAERQRGEEDQMAEQAKQDTDREARWLDPREQLRRIADAPRELGQIALLEWDMITMRPSLTALNAMEIAITTAVSALDSIIDEQDARIRELQRKVTRQDRKIAEFIGGECEPEGSVG